MPRSNCLISLRFFISLLWTNYNKRCRHMQQFVLRIRCLCRHEWIKDEIIGHFRSDFRIDWLQRKCLKTVQFHRHYRHDSHSTKVLGFDSRFVDWQLRKLPKNFGHNKHRGSLLHHFRWGHRTHYCRCAGHNSENKFHDHERKHHSLCSYFKKSLLNDTALWCDQCCLCWIRFSF